MNVEIDKNGGKSIPNTTHHQIIGGQHMSNAADFEIVNDVIRRYTGPGGHVVIPEGITGFWWTVFMGNQNITEITIPESVTEIPQNAFSNCRALKKIHIEGCGLKSLGNGCFHNCEALEELRLPDSVEYLPNSLFTGCTALVKTLGNVTVAADVLLDYVCTPGDNEIRIPEGVRFVSGRAFGLNGSVSRNAAKNVESIHIPEGVVCISREAFEGFGAVQEIFFPKSLRYLGGSALSKMSSLERLDLSHTNLKTIDSSAFFYCSNLKELLLPEGLKALGEWLFCGCSKLHTVKLPASLETVGPEDGFVGTFADSGLKTLVLPEGISSIPRRTFRNCKKLKSVTLPDSVRAIGEDAFIGCVNLTEVNVPAQLQTVGTDAFRHCCKLERPAFPEALTAQEDFWGNIGFGDENGCVVKDGVLIKYVGPLDKVVISEGVTEIPERALSINSNLSASPEEYRLPDSLKVIQDQGMLGSYHNFNLPAGYLRTREALPAGYTITLLNGAWCNLASTGDYAAMYLFQKGKTLLKLCEERLEETPKEAVACFAQILSEDGKSAQVVKAADFILQNKAKIPEESVRAIYDIAVQLKAKKAVELLKPLAGDVPEAPEAAKKTKKPSKKELAAEALCAPFRETFDAYLLEKTFKKNKGKAALLKQVLLKTGEAAPPYLTMCAVVPYLDLMEEKPKHISGYKTDVMPVQLVEKAEQAADLLDRNSLRETLKSLYQGGSSIWLLPLCRYASAEVITDLLADMRKWQDWYTYGVTGRTNIIIARTGMMLSDTREAMMYIEKCGRLNDYARIRGTDADSIRDTVLAEFGLDEKGKKVYDLGGTQIEVSLAPDLTLALLDTKAEKTVKSLPKKGADPDLHAAATKDLGDMKKNLKKVVKARNDMLFHHFLTGQTRPAAGWKASYLSNPVLNMVARLLVWNQGKNTFILGENGPVDCCGNPYAIANDVSIGVAHPMEMEAQTVQQWQQYLCRNNLAQPFEQMWEPGHTAASISKDRYSGTQVSVFRFMHNEKHGISFYDEDFHNEIGFSLEGCELTHERTKWHRHEIGKDETFTLGTFTFRRYSRVVNHLVYLLDKWTVMERILKDDVTVKDILPSFTLAQITEFIKVAGENGCTNVTAVLLEYKNENYADFDPMAEFSLDL